MLDTPEIEEVTDFKHKHHSSDLQYIVMYCMPLLGKSTEYQRFRDFSWDSEEEAVRGVRKIKKRSKGYMFYVLDTKTNRMIDV